MIGPKSLFRDLEARGVKLRASGSGLLQITFDKGDITQAEAEWINKFNKQLLQIVLDKDADNFLNYNRNSIIHANCLDVLSKLPDSCVDQMVCDPPYGLNHMGQDWDKKLSSVKIWKQSWRIIKPGGFLLLLSSSRQDLFTGNIAALVAAGFNTNFTSLYWTYANGFPKIHDVSKVVGKRESVAKYLVKTPGVIRSEKLDGACAGYQPKPAVEIVIAAMKPLSEKSYTDQALSNLKGVTWPGDCKIPYQNNEIAHRDLRKQKSYGSGQVIGSAGDEWPGDPRGRFPANLLVSDNIIGKHSEYFSLDAWTERHLPFLVVPKPSTKEKEAGLENLVPKLISNDGRTPKDAPHHRGKTFKRNIHPCVKPIKLMAYLITMFSRPGDLIADPMAGSGSTCIAAKLLDRQFIGIEQDEEYHKIAQQRVEHASIDNPYWKKKVDGLVAVDKADVSFETNNINNNCIKKTNTKEK